MFRQLLSCCMCLPCLQCVCWGFTNWDPMCCRCMALLQAEHAAEQLLFPATAARVLCFGPKPLLVRTW